MAAHRQRQLEEHELCGRAAMPAQMRQGLLYQFVLVEAIEAKHPYEELIALDDRAHKEISDIIKRRRDEELQLTRRVA